MKYLQFHVTVQDQDSRWIVADCFWNIENSDSPLGAEDSGNLLTLKM